MIQMSDPTNRDNAEHYHIWSVLKQVAFPELVKVLAVQPNSDRVGFVDVQPLVKKQWNSTQFQSRAAIHQLPYFRLQGGKNAVILDPQVGDIGLAIFCARDIERIKTNAQEEAPASNRVISYNDGLYIGGFLNTNPEQIVQFSEDGIHLKTPKKVFIDAPNTEISGDVAIKGHLDVDQNITAKGSITAKGDVKAGSISLNSHRHTNGNKGAPTGGPIG